MLSLCFIPQSMFYTQLVMLCPRFIPQSVFYTQSRESPGTSPGSPQSAVRSPQSIFHRTGASTSVSEVWVLLLGRIKMAAYM